MKKLILFILVLACALSMLSCSITDDEDMLDEPQETEKTVRKNSLLKDAKVESVAVTSFPKGRNFSFSGDAVKPLTDYVCGLDIESEFSEDPEQYSGMTWIIALTYEGGATQTIYHFGNMFIKSDDGPWYRMNDEQAAELEPLLLKLSGLDLYT